MTNEARAKLALEVIQDFTAMDGQDPDSGFVDLLTNMMHLSYQETGDREEFQRRVHTALTHFEAEMEDRTYG